MENITTRPEGQGPFELLNDPVYGPNSKYFWPGSHMHASSYVASPVRISSYVSGEEFLETYAESFSGVANYLESTDYPDESYCDILYDHFHTLYNDVESWDALTLFVSAVYRDLFDKTRPYESRLLELRTRLDYESILKPFLKEGRNNEAIIATGDSPVKEAENGERELSLVTCGRLMKLILARNTDLLLVSELVKVLQRTNIAIRNQKHLKEGLLFMLRDTNPLPFPGDKMKKDLYREKLVLALSLLQIGPEAAQKAADEALSSQNHGPIIKLIRDHPSKREFPSDQTSAYYIGPSYTARDYINDLILSDEAHTSIFEEVRDSAAEYEVTSVLLSFDEEAGKLAHLACFDMIQELFNKKTALIDIVDPVAKSLDEDDLLFTEKRSHKKIFDKIDNKIAVPPEARKRILDICKKRGIPDNQVLAEKILSVASLTRGKGSTPEKLVKAFASLLMLAVVSSVSLRRKVIVVGPVDPLIGISTNQIGETEGSLNKRPSRGASQNLGQFNQTRPQKNRALRQSTVASAKKKVFDFENQTILTTPGDEKKYGGLCVQGFVDETTKELSMEGSCGPIFLLDQLRTGPFSTAATNMGYKMALVEQDHFLPTRARQGMGQDYERKADRNVAQALNPRIHKELTSAGEVIYYISEGIVHTEEYIQQANKGRCKVLTSAKVQEIIDQEGRFDTEYYTLGSERNATWTRKDLRRIAERRGLTETCYKSIIYPDQLSLDATDTIDKMRAYLGRADSNFSEVTKNLLRETEEYVEERLNVMADFRECKAFRDSPVASKNIRQKIDTVRRAYNDMKDMATSLHNITGLRSLQIPPGGEDPILTSDLLMYNNQWSANRIPPQR
ncbi:MAG: hypothetical protein M1812_008330, partial [Candelaria pacifica]